MPKDLVLKGLKSPCVEAPEIHPYFVSPCKEFLMIPYISLSPTCLDMTILSLIVQEAVQIILNSFSIGIIPSITVYLVCL